MAAAKHSLETIFAEIRDAGNHSRRESLRRHVGTYRRNATTLLSWTFPASRAAVTRAIADLGDPAATRTLCHALWRDLQAAKALPRYLAGRSLRISALRMLFACECTRYLRQREPARDRPKARPLTTGEWLSGICREIKTRPVSGGARKTAPRTVARSRKLGGLAAADRRPAAAPCQSAWSYPGPSSGHRK